MKKLIYIFTALLVFTSRIGFAQTDEATSRKIIDAKSFLFQATTVIPLSDNDLNRVLNQMRSATGSIIHLNGSGYDVKVTPDSVVCFLPYYGRAYQSSMSNNDAGIKFTSRDFTYQSKQNKKGGWTIHINPKDIKNGQRLTFNITKNGYATLSVYHNQRQSISFNGYISENVENKAF